VIKGTILYISYDGMTDPLGESQVIPYLEGLSKLGHRIYILSFEKKNRFILHSNRIKNKLQDSLFIAPPIWKVLLLFLYT
jgi:hypothetical protein